MRCSSVFLLVLGVPLARDASAQSVANARSPVVSPDGRHILYTSDRADAPGLYVMDADGSHARRVSAVPGGGVWSADGKHVLVTRVARDTIRVGSIALDGGAETEIGLLLAPGAKSATISANGEDIVYGGGSWDAMQLFHARIGGASRRITPGTGAYWCQRISRDGKRIAVNRSNPDGSMRVWLMDLDGASPREITGFPTDQGRPQCPAWSSDGTRLAVQASVPSAADTTKRIGSIWTIAIRSGTARKVASHAEPYLDELPTWFPDGRRIAFQSDRTGAWEIWTMDADGGHPRQLTKSGPRPTEQVLREALARIVAEQHLVGGTAAISVDGRVYTAAAGLADSGKGIAMLPSHRMLVGSAGKPFFAFVALSLASEGALGLDQPVSRWLGTEPWFAHLQNAPALTMRHLLSHRGGLDSHAGDSVFSTMVRSASAAKLRDGFSPIEQIAVILDRPPPSRAGEEFRYTDTGYLVAALALERATGRTYYDELQRRVLQPLGLTDTAPSDHDDLTGLAQGYNPPPVGQARGFATWGLPATMVNDGRLAINPKFEWTGGGLVSTSRDLALWMETLFEREPWKRFGDAMIERRPSNAPYGYGIFVTSTPDGPLYSHPGGFPGYHTDVAYSPALGVGVAFQTNCGCQSVNGASALRQLLAVARTLVDGANPTGVIGSARK